MKRKSRCSEGDVASDEMTPPEDLKGEFRNHGPRNSDDKEELRKKPTPITNVII